MRRTAYIPLAALLLPTTAWSGSITVLAQIDNTMYSESGAESNGLGEFFFAGATVQGEVRRALVQFNVAAVVPAGSTVNGVQLVLNMSMTVAGPQSVELHRLLASWGEGTSNALGGEGSGAAATTNDATWTRRFFPSTLWANAGGDFDPVASAAVVVGGNGNYTWLSTPALVADVQSWLSTPANNFGWLVMAADEQSTPTTKRFSSRNNPNTNVRPRLVVDFTPPTPPQPYCFGDGSGTACPCANSGATGNGCANSVNAAGANLAATGFASVGADTLVLNGSGLPDSPALYFQGTGQAGGGAGIPFGDGLRCVNGTQVRLGTKISVGGVSHYPQIGTGDTPISVKGSIPGPGAVRHYQCWYRNPAAYCTADTFNYTNGLTVTWVP